MAAALPAVFAGAQIGSSVVGAMGQMAAGDAARRAGYVNSMAQQQEARQALQAGATNAAQIQQDNERRIGAIRAAQGASGITTDTGSSLDLMSDMASQAEMRRQLTLYRGRAQYASRMAQAADTLTAGKDQQTASRIGAVGSILSGISGAARSMYFGYGGGGAGGSGGINLVGITPNQNIMGG